MNPTPSNHPSRGSGALTEAEKRQRQQRTAAENQPAPTHSWKQKNWFLIAILAYVLGLITPDIQRLIAPGSLLSPASSPTVIVDTVRR